MKVKVFSLILVVAVLAAGQAFPTGLSGGVQAGSPDRQAEADVATEEDLGDLEADTDDWGNDAWDDEENTDDWGDEWGDDASTPWTGFAEVGLGGRTVSNPPLDRTATLEELRVQLKNDWQVGGGTFALTIDGLYDGVVNEWRLDPREVAFIFSPGSRTDARVGRQILTWGTGDLLFLNDLFPKDFESFFAGRDEEYLKAPSDAVRLSHFGEVLNVDLVWMPEFEPDRYLTGERFSFFSPVAGDLVAPDAGRVPAPDNFPSDGELALRVFRTSNGVEWAGYGYRGFFKSPLGQGEQPFYPRLDVYGASSRWPLGSGLANVEFAYYRSADDRSGARPEVPNDQVRLLMGFEAEVASGLTLATQAYVEHTRDHAALLDASPWPEFEPVRNRTVATLRLTHRAFRERLVSSFFAFVSPSDNDWHLRPRVDWRYSDRWTYTAGANLFGGDERYTFFSQLDGNDNVYLRARLNF